MGWKLAGELQRTDCLTKVIKCMPFFRNDINDHTIGSIHINFILYEYEYNTGINIIYTGTIIIV